MKKPEDCSTIEEIREAIDRLDVQIVELLGERFRYVKEIVKYKNKDEESIVAKERKEQVIKSRRDLAERNGLDPDVIEKMYRDLISYFIKEELDLIGE